MKTIIKLPSFQCDGYLIYKSSNISDWILYCYGSRQSISQISKDGLGSLIELLIQAKELEDNEQA